MLTSEVEPTLVGEAEPFPDAIKKPSTVPWLIRTHSGEHPFTLCAPDDPEDECPIALAPIRAHTLDFMPAEHSSFLPDRKELTAARLPCNHTFSAMALVYHWYKNKTLACPICRRGPVERPQHSSLPREWRDLLLRHIKDRSHEESHDDMHAQITELQRLVADEIEYPAQFNFFILSHHFSISVYLYGQTVPEVSAMNMNIAMHPARSQELVWGIFTGRGVVFSMPDEADVGMQGDEFVFHAHEESLRGFRLVMSHFPDGEFIVKAHMRTHSEDLMQIDATERVRLPPAGSLPTTPVLSTVVLPSSNPNATLSITHAGDLRLARRIELRVKRVYFTQISLA